MGTTAKEAWEELEKVHASKDKQRKFGLLKQLYRLDMAPGSSLVEHERTFDGLVEGLAAMGRVIEPEDLVVIYSDSLPAEYNTWLQGQSSTLDEVTMSEFKGCVREETRRMINLSNGVTNERTTANFAKKNTKRGGSKAKKGNCHRCGKPGHHAKDCRVNLEDKDKDNDK